jgi:hypothetical protein
MEFNKEVTSASSGLVYVCFWQFCKVVKQGRIQGGASGTCPPKIEKKTKKKKKKIHEFPF